MSFIPFAQYQSMSERERADLLRTHIRLGCHPDGDILVVSNVDRQSGMAILGLPGGGKSGFIENLLAQDIASGQAVIHFDPHGDSVQNVIARLPEDKLQNTYLLDMLDEEYPFPVNVFTSHHANGSIAQAQAVERTRHIFETLWPETHSQQYLPRYLQASIITLFCNPGSTLGDMYRLLTDGHFRQRMLKNVIDQQVLSFWSLQYVDLPVAARMQRVGALLGRLESLFMGRSLVRNIVNQRQVTLDWRDAILKRHIMLVKLPIKTLKNDASLLGTMLIAQPHAAIFSFADPPPQERPGVSLYMDEFQNFATPDFSEFITEARKYGVRLTVAHQYRDQLPAYLQASTMASRIKVCFQITPDDARDMATLFPDSEASVRPEDIDHRPVEHLLDEVPDCPEVQTFVEVYLRRLRFHKGGNTIEIQRPGLRTDHFWYPLLNVPAPTDTVTVPDPTIDLNHLFYTVMKTGDDTLRSTAETGRARLPPGWLPPPPQPGAKSLLHDLARASAEPGTRRLSRPAPDTARWAATAQSPAPGT